MNIKQWETWHIKYITNFNDFEVSMNFKYCQSSQFSLSLIILLIAMMEWSEEVGSLGYLIYSIIMIGFIKVSQDFVFQERFRDSGDTFDCCS